MAEPYNFPKHLREIVGEPLKELGFKQKRCSFSRENSMFKEKIYFTRNKFKNKGFKIFLIFNINYIDVTGVCLRHLRAINCPSLTYVNYHYNSEEELKQELTIALTEIINTSLPYFLKIFDNLKNKSHKCIVSNIMRSMRDYLAKHLRS